MVIALGRRVESYEEPIYSLVRVIVGLLFMQHGAQKLFGLFGGVDGSGATASLVSLYGVAGIIEFFGGFLIAVGLLTRLIALIATGEMIAAQLIAHFPEGIIPIQNGGELSLLYLAVFLLLIVYGNGYYSLQHRVFGQEHI
ncbi:DoxX family protein [Haladaptatus salinisoli]|uniref:DoxX family protein n=1 Tax=Haladaptatus salinisoli TaxID=2884876 RepID=UPI001D09A91E|nr:DoxX family protein [Haladaptatus salinisoli]